MPYQVIELDYKEERRRIIPQQFLTRMAAIRHAEHMSNAARVMGHRYVYKVADTKLGIKDLVAMGNIWPSSHVS